LRYNDGSGWQTIGVWTRGVNINNNTFYTSTVTLDAASYNLTNGAQFRFQCDASANNDLIYIDAVTITGNSGSSLMAGNNGVEVSTTPLLAPSGKGEPMGWTNDLDIDAMVYPTPATNVLNINSEDRVESVEIYSVNGALIFKVEPKDNRIDISSLSAGMYLITIKTEEETINEKFVKE
ncbi:MAG: T9SS type A sorting domain-containing protein, partial [Bacteroidetes bacterium]|nr:T9SS type A sorting domain-containing protein [Bacteroidota bacterium]